MLEIIIRSGVGIILAVLGYFLGNSFAPSPPFLLPYLFQTLTAFVGGLFGALVLPYLIVRVSTFLKETIRSSVRSTFWEVMKSRAALKKKGKKNNRGGIANGNGTPKTLLDTSVLIDGRLLDVVSTGFLGGELVAPRFVLEELQRIADSSEVLRRNRGRKGLEILEALKKNKEARLRIEERETEGKDVDGKLIKLAKALKARIATVDFNLNKVAKVSGVTVLNVNELANALKTVVLPGEELLVKLIQEGKEAGQGVGYLADGTMIVVENGQTLLGGEVKVVVSRILQTAAGRMVFAQTPAS